MQQINAQALSNPWVRAVAVSVVATLVLAGAAQAAVTLNANIDTDGTITADGLVTGTAGATVTGAAVNLNASSNFAVNVATGTSTGTVTIGSTTGAQGITIQSGTGDVTVTSTDDMALTPTGDLAINTGDWDITAAGVMTGIGAITADGDLTLSGATTNLVRSVQAGVTADVGSAQGGSAMTADFLEISVSANAGDAVTLPAAAAGVTAMITNHGAQSADVFPASGDAINEAAADSAKALAANASLLCYAYDATNWECLTLAR